MDAFIQHSKTAVEILLAAHGLALVIVNLTKTPADDAVVAKVYKVIEVFAGFITKLSKK